MGQSQESTRHAGRLSGHRTAFTLVELLVVIGILGVLIATLLPAVMAVRDSGRRVHCQNSMRQMGLAAASHLAAVGHFPSNGWGYLWVGEPDRGDGPDQPGGWIYALLPQMELMSLREVGSNEPPRARRWSLASLCATPAPAFVCPSRRGSGLLPASVQLPPRNAAWAPMVAKTDYAINEGDFITNTLAGPDSLEAVDRRLYRWPNLSEATGVSYLRSRISSEDVVDGLSDTYLIGEKYVSSRGYESSTDPGFDQAMYCGVDLDLNRWTVDVPLPDGHELWERRFGSSHAPGCMFVFCDGHVEQIGYDVDPSVHRMRGNRSDGPRVE